MFIFINNKKYQTTKGLTLLQACNKLGFEIPRFCYHEKLTIAGNCRMCLIEISRPRGPVKPKPAASCAITSSDGIFLHVNTVLVKKARESVLEFLLINHPLDCPICDQGGECDLQDQTMIYGNDRGRFYETKRTVNDKNCGPLIKTSMNRCIHCTRCVRFGNEVAGVGFLGTTGRGILTEIAPYINKFNYSEISGNIIDLCPVGALTSKPYSYKARPWELKSIETIDILDSICSNIRIDMRGVELMRILPRTNEELNEDWITDKTRFFYDALLKQRINKPLLKFGSNFIKISWENIFLWLGKNFFLLKSSKYTINGIVGRMSELESIIVLKDFLNILGSSFYYMEESYRLQFDFIYNYVFCRTLGEIEQGDFIVLCGLNPRLELPLLNIRIRKSVLDRSTFVCVYGHIMNLTYKNYKISNKITTLINLIEGKSLLCRRMLKIKNPFILQGDFSLYRLDSEMFSYLQFFTNNLLVNLKVFIDRKIIFNYIPQTTGIINAAELGFYSKLLTYEYLKNKNIYMFYFLNVSNKRFLYKLSKEKNRSFLIYQGNIGTELSSICDIVLPGCNFIEQKLTFINLERRIQHTKYIKMPPFLSRSDWSIIVALSFFLKKNEKYSKLIALKNRLLQITPIIKNIKNIENKKQKSIEFFIEKFNIIKIILIEFPIISNFYNFYDSDNVTRNSQILSLVSKKFIKNYNYFDLII
jgi:NADH dehydrogenase (ubiquinone) Fe-S protein 1